MSPAKRSFVAGAVFVASTALFAQLASYGILVVSTSIFAVASGVSAIGNLIHGLVRVAEGGCYDCEVRDREISQLRIALIEDKKSRAVKPARSR